MWISESFTGATRETKNYPQSGLWVQINSDPNVPRISSELGLVKSLIKIVRLGTRLAQRPGGGGLKYGWFKGEAALTALVCSQFQARSEHTCGTEA